MLMHKIYSLSLSLSLSQVFASTILQQVFVVEFVVHGQMCEECQRREAKDYWRAMVQVRQKVRREVGGVCVLRCTKS